MGIYTKKNNALCCKSNGETIIIEPWGQNSLRVRSVPMGKPQEAFFALLPQTEIATEITFNEDTAEIKNGNIKACVEKDGWAQTCRISFFNSEGELLLEERTRGGALAIDARKFKPIIGGDYRLTVSFTSDENEKLYGMGQYQQDMFNVKNCNFELAHRNSQVSIPFVLSDKGYGFFWHNPAVGRASFARNCTEWYAESTKQMDYWITAANTPQEIIHNYMNVTGKPPMMPEYGMGFWQCKLRYWNQEQLLEVAREYHRRQIPVDVIVCDFFHWPKMGDFRFDPEFFPNPKAMVDELKAMGMELMVSVWPQVALESENFNEMKQQGFLVKPEMGVNVCMQFGGDSVFYDATNPEARKFVWDKCKQNYYDYGIKIFWLDEAEPEFGVYDYDNYRYHIGPNVQVGNVYPQLFSKTFYDGMQAQGQQNIVNLVRCAWAGSQRYGALVWSGDIHSDYEFMRRQIVAGLHMGICGIPWWTTDIGGFMGGNPDDPAFRELLVRWFQYGTFCPVMRLHGDRLPSTPLYRKNGEKALFTGGNNEVWSYGEDVCEILVKYIQLREKMRPYTSLLMQEAHEKGSPVMRAMFYEFPQDKECWDIKDQYMYGADILVAPVIEKGAVKRSVYLPKGCKWHNVINGKEYDGGQYLQVDAPLDKIPVFCKNGMQKELFVNS